MGDDVVIIRDSITRLARAHNTVEEGSGRTLSGGLDAQSLEKDTAAYLEGKGLALGDLVHAVRVAVTGTAAGPGLFDCLELIGKTRCLHRIDRALEKARG